MGWLDSLEHNRWLSWQMSALLHQGRKAKVPAGFAVLDIEGGYDPKLPLELYVTARMTEIYSLGTLMGIPGCRRYSDHGVSVLTKVFKDQEAEGWLSAVQPELDADGHGVLAPGRSDKKQFADAHVLLAAATATAANRPGALELFQEAMHIQERYWWDKPNSLVRDSYDRGFTECANYRSVASNTHTIEAYLAAADISGDPRWLDRAVEILEFIYNKASQSAWRIQDNYDSDLNEIPDYNKDDLTHHINPYGVNVGRAMMVVRLALQARAALRELERETPDWLRELAVELFERARVEGWRSDGKSGFLYTTDYEGRPLVRNRLSWVVAEGISAAVFLRRSFLDDGADLGEVEHYDHCYRSWIDYTEEYLIKEPGVWYRELDENNVPTNQVSGSSADIVHSVQSLLVPRLPLWPNAGSALVADLLDKPTGRPPRDLKKKRHFWNS